MSVALAGNWRTEVDFTMTTRKLPLTPDHFATYQVIVQGRLAPDWTRYYQGITSNFDGEITTLTGIRADQSALRGLLCYLWDFNLTVLSVALAYPGENHLDANCQNERE